MRLVKHFAGALHEDEEDEGEPEGQVDGANEQEVPEGASRVQLAVGQHVEVRTREGDGRRGGDLIATGYISELNTETRVVRIVDRGSGTDLQIDADPEMYDIWLQDREVTGKAPTPAKKPRSSANPRRPGAYVGGQID